MKDRLIGATGSVSGATSVLGSWQVCHNLCLGVIALLGILGVTVVGMPLMFLTRIAIPFWIAAFVLLLVTIGFYVKKRCISSRLIMFNSGLIIAGIPFKPLQAFSKFFWFAGGTLAVAGISLFVKDKIQKRMVKV